MPRFGRGSRLLHWVHALPFFALLLTGLALLIPELKGYNVVGQRIVSLLHLVAAGIFVLGPLAVYLAIDDRRLVHRDVRRLASVARLDLAWLRFAALTAIGVRGPEPPSGKFNAGQKLNTLYTIALGFGLGVTGLILAINLYQKGVFDLAFVERAFRLHDVFMVAAIPAVAIHVYLATVNPATRESLRGITRGFVRGDWARRHHRLWAEDQDGEGLP